MPKRGDVADSRWQARQLVALQVQKHDLLKIRDLCRDACQHILCGVEGVDIQESADFRWQSRESIVAQVQIQQSVDISDPARNARQTVFLHIYGGERGGEVSE